MAKIFQKNNGPDVDVKRNTFDLSYANHLTGNIGDIIPVMCQEVLPGDSFQIDPKFGLRFNPTVFPIQTKMHGIMHFWYVRNRNLMTKWPEYIGRTDDDVVMPYISVDESNASKIFGTGSIGDYLGIPSSLTGEYAQSISVPLHTYLSASEREQYSNGIATLNELPIVNFRSTALGTVNALTPTWLSPEDGSVNLSDLNRHLLSNYNSGNGLKVKTAVNMPAMNPHIAYQFHSYGYWSQAKLKYPVDRTAQTYVMAGTSGLGSSAISQSDNSYLVVALGDRIDTPLGDATVAQYFRCPAQYDGSKLFLIASPQFADFVNEHMGSVSVYVGLFWLTKGADSGSFQSNPNVLPTASGFKKAGDNIIMGSTSIVVKDATDPMTVGFNPFVTHTGETTPKIKINALPFRAYEAVYNFAYRDETVDPLVVNGKEVYNDFITTHADGADTTPYHIFQRNWERDYYTSCQVSPQQGNAPLVGISANGTFTFSDGTNEYTATATVGDDGETITGISTYSPDMPQGALRQMADYITNGISINDLRNVNSLQRWLETNIRRGYKYVDQIYSHFGVNPAFKANDCPDFLGGIHVTGDVNQINNMTGDGLGNYAGQLSMFGGSNNKISKYCDEHGYIIGVMCVFPEPTYTQMLPKLFTKTVTPLDFYFPEFGHIGMQPVTYNEVTPLEVAASDASNSTDTINDTFGYQRAWADYLANTDQVHGDFRGDMSEFVISRVFHEKPQLGHDFIAIDHNDVDDVFVTNDGSNKVLGEIRFDIKAQRPIPMYGIPSLE